MAAPASYGSISGGTIIAGSQFSNARITIGDSRVKDFPPQQASVCRANHFPRNEDFVQRSIISDQLARLLPPRPDYQSAALWGLGGSGKTQLALEYTYDRASDPACSVFWVHADTETSFTQDYKWIATKLGISGDLEGEKLLTAVRANIESLPQWVLVLDNADDLGLFGIGRGQNLGRDTTTNLSAYIPRGTVGTVLWTSRDQRIAGSLVGARRGINVIRMTEAEAETLFQTHAILEIGKGHDEYGELVRLLDKLDWLPLAITQAAAYIRRTKASIGQYLQMLQQKQKKRWRVLKRSEQDPHRRPEVTNSVLETWNISMEYIKTENEMAYDILTVLAYVDSQSITFQLVAEIIHNKNDNGLSNLTRKKTTRDDCSTNSTEDTSSDSEWCQDEDDIGEAIARLEEFSFLTSRGSKNDRTKRSDRTYDMHKLVQEAISYNMHLQDDNHSKEALLARSAFRVINNLFPKTWSRETWDECEQYLGHAQRTAEWVQSHNGEEDVARLLIKVSNYLYSKGRWQEKEPVDILVVKLLKKSLGKRHIDTIQAMGYLGTAYHEQGKFEEAEIIYKEVLGLQRQMQGDKHPDTIWSMADLAMTYNAQGKYNEAEVINVEVLGLRLEILGDKHPDTITSMAALATTYNEQGKYDEAEIIRAGVLELRRDILGKQHPDTIRSMAHLAMTYHSQRKFDEAEKISAKVLGLRRKILGDKHPDTIQSMADLASSYHSQGKFEEAEIIYVEVLGLHRDILGDKHPDTFRSMANLAVAYHSQGKYDMAESLAVKLPVLCRDKLGAKHPYTIWVMANLASTYHALQRFQEAEEIYLEVVQLRREVLGDDHLDTLRSMSDLEKTQHALKSMQGADDIDCSFTSLSLEQP